MQCTRDINKQYILDPACPDDDLLSPKTVAETDGTSRLMLESADFLLDSKCAAKFQRSYPLTNSIPLSLHCQVLDCLSDLHFPLAAGSFIHSILRLGEWWYSSGEPRYPQGISSLGCTVYTLFGGNKGHILRFAFSLVLSFDIGHLYIIPGDNWSMETIQPCIALQLWYPECSGLPFKASHKRIQGADIQVLNPENRCLILQIVDYSIHQSWTLHYLQCFLG